jgi:hypothetical protein
MPRSAIFLLLLTLSGLTAAVESVRFEQGQAWDLQKKRLLYTSRTGRASKTTCCPNAPYCIAALTARPLPAK